MRVSEDFLLLAVSNTITVMCMRWSVDVQQFREVSRTRTTYSTETHTSDLKRSKMGSRCSFSRRGVQWW